MAKADMGIKILLKRHFLNVKIKKKINYSILIKKKKKTNKQTNKKKLLAFKQKFYFL